MEIYGKCFDENPTPMEFDKIRRDKSAQNETLPIDKIGSANLIQGNLLIFCFLTGGVAYGELLLQSVLYAHV